MSTPPAEPDHSESRNTSGEPPAANTADSEPQGSESSTGHSDPPEDEPKLPDSLTFRITPVALLVVLTIAVCASPAAAAVPWLSLLYLIPLALLVWILRVRTTVHRDGLTVRTVTRQRELRWDEIRSLHLSERRWVRAVTRSGGETRLPAVRVRDLPRLAAMSGGRLSNPDEHPGEGPPNGDATSDE